jgi:hypothetical protein
MIRKTFYNRRIFDTGDFGAKRLHGFGSTNGGKPKTTEDAATAETEEAIAQIEERMETEVPFTLDFTSPMAGYTFTEAKSADSKIGTGDVFVYRHSAFRVRDREKQLVRYVDRRDIQRLSFILLG